MDLLERMAAPQAMELAGVAAPEPGREGGVPRLVAHLVVLAGMLKELETQAHLVHANAEGPGFLEVHAFLKERYEEHLEQLDQVLEAIRTLDHFAPMCSCGLKEAAGCFRHTTSYETREMLTTYYGNIEAMGYLAKQIEQVAGEVEAPDVQNLMAELVGSAFKTSWMLKAVLRRGV